MVKLLIAYPLSFHLTQFLKEISSVQRHTSFIHKCVKPFIQSNRYEFIIILSSCQIWVYSLWLTIIIFWLFIKFEFKNMNYPSLVIHIKFYCINLTQLMHAFLKFKTNTLVIFLIVNGTVAKWGRENRAAPFLIIDVMTLAIFT